MRWTIDGALWCLPAHSTVGGTAGWWVVGVTGLHRSAVPCTGAVHLAACGTNTTAAAAAACRCCCAVSVLPLACSPTPCCPNPCALRYEELELLVEGLPHLDFGALQAGARYAGGYSEASPTVQHLW